MQEIELRSAIESNIIQLGTLTMEAHADRLIIVQDEFRSGYECPVCFGTGAIRCDSCNGMGKSPVAINAKCQQCKGERTIVCPECEGHKIIQGGLHVPETSENKPTTGTIVSIGPEAAALNRFQRGNSVLYPSYCGYAYTLTATDIHGEDVVVTLVILRESEVVAKISGHLELRRVKRKAALSTAM